MIHVCSLARVPETVKRSGARRLVSLLTEGTAMVRPQEVADADHLTISVNDIWEAQEGMVLPAEKHVEALLGFARAWDRAQPLVVHCYAGISRSTASALIVAAALAPARDEAELAQALRKLSPTATPNPRLIALGDAMLGRNGRLVEAVRAIGRGADAMEGTPFALKIDR